MRDDFNTSLAISYLFALGKEINILHQSVMTGGQKPDGKLVDMMDKAWKEMTSIIGILEEDPGAKTEAVKPRISRKQMPSVTNLPKKAFFWKIRLKACGGKDSEI